MNLTAAARLAKGLMTAHGLSTKWSFEFDRALLRFGNCNYRLKKITLSAKLTLLNDEHQVRDTILHEIAHALVPSGAGHGRKWKAVARSIGASPERCFGGEVVAPPRKYIGTCPTCATTIARNRRRRLSCGKCDRKFNSAHVFVWSEFQADRSASFWQHDVQ